MPINKKTLSYCFLINLKIFNRINNHEKTLSNDLQLLTQRNIVETGLIVALL